MAKPSETAKTLPTEEKFDLSAFLPQGISESDLKITGGLTPIYSPKEVFEGGFAPVAGWIDRVIDLPTVVQSATQSFDPRMIIVRDIQAATKGVRGKIDARTAVDVAKGDDILVPVTGNIETNRELIQALTDKEHVYFGVFRIKGQTRVNNQPSLMWVWEILCAMAKPKKREGVYSLPHAKNATKLLSAENLYHGGGETNAPAPAAAPTTPAAQA